MPLIFIIGLVFLVVVLLAWLIIFLVIQDFKVPTRSLNYRRILAIFPHPDDESLSVGGLMPQMVAHGGDTALLILTKGECGTPDAHFDKKLKKVRSFEAHKSAALIGVNHLTHLDLGDGQLKNKRVQVKQRIDRQLQKFKPDLVITFDLTGLYGHNDHIACAEVVTELIHKKYPTITLWYASFPQKMYQLMSLPEHMATDKGFKNRRVNPTHKIWLGTHVLSAIKSVYAHESQLGTFLSSFPFKPLPAWFFMSAMMNAYFHEVTFKK